MYENIVNLIELSGVAFPRFGDGVSEETVRRAEESVGFSFPDSFRWWLLNYGGGQIGGDVVYGLDEGGRGMADVVGLYRANVRDGLCGTEKMVFCMGNEEYFFFDVSKSRSGQELEVFIAEPSLNESELYAPDFAGFLDRRIRETYRV